MNVSSWFTIRLALIVVVLSIALNHRPASAADTQLEITLYKASSIWYGKPGAAVIVEIMHDGILVASATTKNTVSGRSFLRPQRPGTGEAYPIQPGDRLLIQEDGALLYDAVVPIWGLDVNAETQTIDGITKPDTRVTIDVVKSDLVTVLDSTSPRADVSGQVTVTSSMITADSIIRMTLDVDATRYIFLAMPLSVSVDLGRGIIQGWATPGSTVTVSDERGVLISEDHRRMVVNRTSSPYGGAWSIVSPRVTALSPGTKLTISRQGPTGASEKHDDIIAPLSVSFRWQERNGEGYGPSDALINIQAGVGGRVRASFDTMTDNVGRFAIDLPTDALVEPGWWIRAIYSPRSGFATWAHSVWSSARVNVYGTTVKGIADAAGSSITCTLFDRARNLKRRVNTLSDSSLSFVCGFIGPNGTADPVLDLIHPGDRLEIESSQGDPTILVVPTLTANADIEKGEVHGFAIPGSAIHVGRWREHSAAYVDGKAQLDGSYAVSFASSGGIVRGDNGSIDVIDSNGNQFTMGWSAIRVTVWLGGQDGDWPTSVEGNAPMGRMVDVDLLDTQGRQIGTGHGRTDVLGSDVIAGEMWRLVLEDVAGVPYDAVPGDQLRITAGDQTVSMTVPPLVARLDVAARSLTGQTLPHHDVTIGYGRSPNRITSRRVISDRDGSFAISGSDLKEVLYNDDAWAEIRVDGHTIGRGVPGPGLVVDLDSSSVEGWLPGAAQVEGQITRGDQTVCPLFAATGRDAGFSATCRDPGGERVFLKAGDVISLDGGSNGRLGLTVPVFDIRLDSAKGAIVGDVDGVSSIAMEPLDTVMRGSHSWTQERMERSIRGREHFETAIPDYEQHRRQMRGTGYLFLGSLSDGNMVTRRDFIPLVNIQVGGGAVCGPATPRKAIRITVNDDTAVVGSFVGSSDESGAFNGLIENGGASVMVSAGNTVSMMVDGRNIDSFTVPPLAWSMERGILSVFGPVVDKVLGTAWPAVSVYALAPVGDCLSFTDQPGLGSHIPVIYRNRAVTNQRGEFEFELLPGVTGRGLGISEFTDEGLRAYRKQLDMQIVVYPEEGNVEAFGDPFVGGAIAVDRNGQSSAFSEVTADAKGRVAMVVRGGLTVGDVISATLGNASDKVLVVPLSVDWSSTSGLTVRTISNTPLQSVFKLRDGRLLTVVGRTDAQGDYRLVPGDLSGRSSWGFDSVAEARVEVPLGDNDLEVVRIAVNPDEGGRYGVAYLPLTLRRAVMRRP